MCVVLISDSRIYSSLPLELLFIHMGGEHNSTTVSPSFIYFMHFSWAIDGRYPQCASAYHTLIGIESYAIQHVLHSAEDGDGDVKAHLLSHFAVMLVGSSSQIRN